MTAIEPAALVQSVTILAQHAAAARNVSLQFQEQPSREISCDAEQIKQLLLNLILNAIQATPTGGIVLIQSFFETDRLCVEVCDEGGGIAPQAKERIFEPFFTTKDAGKGAGLGLATVYGVVKQSGGAISVTSEPGAGSTFRIVLPLSIDDEPDLELDVWAGVLPLASATGTPEPDALMNPAIPLPSYLSPYRRPGAA